ncbi:MAG: cytochrome P450 [Planctomycetota bacterium]
MNSLNQSRDFEEFTGSIVRPPWFYRQWMLAGNPAYFFKRLADEFGDFVHYRGLFSFYQVNHPALVKQVLMGTHKSFDKRNIIYRRFAHAFGDGLTVSEGDKWKRHRKIMQPMFGPLTVKKFFAGMRRATVEMTDRWLSKYANQRPFDVAAEMDDLTLRVAGEAFFSEGFQRDAERIGQWNDVINFYCAKPPLPIIRSPWFPSSVNRRLKRALGEFHQFIGEMIQARRSERSQDDLLSILLAARHEDSGAPLTEQEIKEEVLGMIIGGHETSSRALAWTWYELAKHPSVAAKLDEELDRVVGDGELSVEHIPQLRYTRMVIDESLRLHPPFWFENRNAMEDVELGGETIPKGSIVLFSRHALHRHPEFWGQPDTFDPERQNPDCPENSRTSCTQIPFGGGPRICIGINFAIMELVTIVAIVRQRFDLKIADQDRHEMCAKMTMFPKHGVTVVGLPKRKRQVLSPD